MIIITIILLRISLIIIILILLLFLDLFSAYSFKDAGHCPALFAGVTPRRFLGPSQSPSPGTSWNRGTPNRWLISWKIPWKWTITRGTLFMEPPLYDILSFSIWFRHIERTSKHQFVQLLLVYCGTYCGPWTGKIRQHAFWIKNDCRLYNLYNPTRSMPLAWTQFTSANPQFDRNLAMDKRSAWKWIQNPYGHHLWIAAGMRPSTILPRVCHFSRPCIWHMLLGRSTPAMMGSA